MTKNVNKLPIKQNGQYKNLELSQMSSDDVIVVEKIHDAVKRTPKKGTKFNPDKEWTMCQTAVKYNGDQVGFFFPSGPSSNGYVENVTHADVFDKLGPAGTKVQIAVTEGIGKDKKGKKIVTRDYTFSLAPEANEVI